MTRTWDIRRARQEDAPDIQALFREVFQREQSVSHYFWKFWSNSESSSVVMVADTGQQIVGHCALWAVPLRLGRERVSGAQPVDVMTHPAYQRQGIFVALAEAGMKLAAERGVEAMYGFPNANAHPGWIRRMDWDHTGDIGVWVRPLQLSKHSRIPRALGPLADAVARFAPRGSSRGYEIANVMPEDEILEFLLADWAKKDSLCRVDRTISRFRWRFCREACMSHEWITARCGTDESCAFAVWGADRDTGNAVLSEVMGSSLAARIAVISAALASAARADHPLMLSVTNDEELVPAMRRCGFLRAKRTPLIVRKLTARTLGANVHYHGNWRIQASDLDAY